MQAVANGEISRLMLFCPPGSAKTTYSSRLFPAWFFQNHPGAHIIGASHTTTLAEQLSGDVQKLVIENQHIFDYRPLSERRDLWTCSNGCMYLAAGAGVGIAGFRADMAIIDDPIRSRADADSETLRDKVWRWYLSDVLPRLKPNGRVIVILTRWHEDDLVGRLLETQREQWTVVELPALAGEGDALGREPGEPLWCDDGYGYGQELLQKREQYARDGALRDWEALYQQQPRPPTGAIFDCSKITVVDLVTNVQRQCRAWDLAATASAGTRDADATVGLKLARLTDGRYAVLDVIRLRGGPAEVEAAIQATACGDGTAVPIVLPQDPGQAGKYQLQHLARGLA
ncbi:MAG: terminase family protein, partial [Acetobacteraceae bacterium]|nr:terminase family protein [Acetobacteraceae bacterium]